MHKHQCCYSLNEYDCQVRKVLTVAVMLLLLMLMTGRVWAQEQYEVKFGTVRFHSEAPHEMISAYSSKLKGAIDAESKSFKFDVHLNTFKGFNCPLLSFFFKTACTQTTAYATASFTGTVLDETDFSKEGEYYVRAKGKMKIQGREQYVFVKVHVVSREDKLVIDTSLPVAFEDYDIRVPKMFGKDVVNEVVVDVTATLIPSTKISMK